MRCLRKLLAFCAVTIFFTGVTSALAADAPAKRADRSAGDAVCTKCHDQSWDKPILAMYQTKHGTKADPRTPGCQTCHGASEKHLESPANPADIRFTAKSTNTIRERSDTCLGCHRADANRSHWEGSTHMVRELTCASCHTVHAAKDPVLFKATQFEVCFQCHKEQRSRQNLPSRHAVIEGKIGCADCHNPHGSVGPRLMKRDSIVETCYQCHMEKRGPFVHNHQPVNEDCTNCHNPHGTVTESMLKVRPPFLCHQCHTPHGGFVPQLLGAQIFSPATTVGPVPCTSTSCAVGKSTTNLTQARGCLNCHTQVHGSNNPSATNPTPQFFLR
jgi:DmsE family decaheme c-type cytochrome